MLYLIPKLLERLHCFVWTDLKHRHLWIAIIVAMTAVLITPAYASAGDFTFWTDRPAFVGCNDIQLFIHLNQTIKNDQIKLTFYQPYVNSSGLTTYTPDSNYTRTGIDFSDANGEVHVIIGCSSVIDETRHIRYFDISHGNYTVHTDSRRAYENKPDKSHDNFNLGTWNDTSQSYNLPIINSTSSQNVTSSMSISSSNNSTSNNSTQTNNTEIINQAKVSNNTPSWLKKVFEWYDKGQLSESDMLSLIKWLIENKIIGV